MGNQSDKDPKSAYLKLDFGDCKDLIANRFFDVFKRYFIDTEYGLSDRVELMTALGVIARVRAKFSHYDGTPPKTHDLKHFDIYAKTIEDCLRPLLQTIE
jgi:hypothetical protein